MADPAGQPPDPAQAVDFTAQQLTALSAACGLTRPGDREPGPDDVLHVIDVAAILGGAAARILADADLGPWDD